MTVNPEFLYNTDSETHLRDARHAHNFYVQHNHAFSPKVKFLYHVVFDLRDGFARNRAPNTDDYKKQIAVLAKTVDLPSFKAQVDVKQQYNRKKNVQTRIDYDEVAMTFHDDNVGITRALLEEYYRYYFRDGNKNDGNGFPLGFDPRDTYRSLNHKYGMDNFNVRSPFFGYIKIYQLSRQKWHSYTLINPLLTSWNHDTLDYSDSQIMENTMNVAYEGVLYNSGDINNQGANIGFGDQETAYDQVHSPLNTQQNTANQNIVGSEALRAGPTLNGDVPNTEQRLFNVISNNANQQSLISQLDTRNQTTGIQQILFPFTDVQNQTATVGTQAFDSRVTDSDRVAQELTDDPDLLDSVIARAVGTGALDPSQGPQSLSTLDLSEEQRETLGNQVIAGARANNTKIIRAASIAIQNKNQRNQGIV